MQIRISKNTVVVGLILATLTVFSVIVTGIDIFADNQIGMIPIWTILYSLLLYVAFSTVIKNRNELFIVSFAWIVRLACAIIGTLGMVYLNGGDEYGFMDMASCALRGTDPATGFRAEVWRIFFAEYHIFGESQFLIRISNGFLCMLGICVFMNALSYLHVNERVRTVLLSVVALAPNTIILSIGMLREPIYYLGTMLSFYFFIRWTDSRSLKHMVLCLLVTLPSVWLHSGHVVITAAYVIIFLLARPRRRLSMESLIKLGLITVGVLGIIVIIATGWYGVLLAKIPFKSDMSSFIETISHLNYANYSVANSGYLGFTVNMNSMAQFVMYTPLRMIYFLYSPLIWDCYRVKDLFGFIFDSMIYLASTIVIIRCAWKEKNRRISKKERDKSRQLIILCGVLIILFVSFAFGWGTIAAGTAMRHRNLLIPIMAVMVGAYHSETDCFEREYNG